MSICGICGSSNTRGGSSVGDWCLDCGAKEYMDDWEKPTKVSQSDLAKDYVRCRFCDSSYSKDQVPTLVRMGNHDKCCHPRVEFDCPVCGLKNDEGFIFPQST